MRERSSSHQLYALESWAGIERRCSPRVQIDSLAQMKVVDSAVPLAPSLGTRVLGASRHGLQLHVGFIFPRGPVEVTVFNRVVSGDVRYCVSDGQDFRVGIRLNEGF